MPAVPLTRALVYHCIRSRGVFFLCPPPPPPCLVPTHRIDKVGIDGYTIFNNYNSMKQFLVFHNISVSFHIHGTMYILGHFFKGTATRDLQIFTF